MHMKTLHGGQRNYKCDFCGKSFTTYIRKSEEAKEEEQSNYKCQLCEKLFSQGISLKTHIKRILDPIVI